MRDSKKIFILLAILAVIFIACKKNDSQVLVLTEVSPPYNYIYQDSALGFSSEIVRRLLQTAGIDADIKFMDWSRTFHTAVNRPNTLIFSIARTKEREELFTWIGRLSTDEAAVFARSNNLTRKPTTFAQLSDYSFRVIKDTYFYDYLKDTGFEIGNDNISLTPQDLINELVLGKTDLIIEGRNTINFTIRSMGYYLSEFEEVLRFPEEEKKELYIAANPNSDPELIDKMVKAYNQLKNSGAIDNIISKYLDDR